MNIKRIFQISIGKEEELLMLNNCHILKSTEQNVDSMQRFIKTHVAYSE